MTSMAIAASRIAVSRGRRATRHERGRSGQYVTCRVVMWLPVAAVP